uniref:Carrier domain-containing protein n=1 Tax=Peronospora matthiolae TaxID=2874970 RepID=A0AAV1UM66_9STRA
MRGRVDECLSTMRKEWMQSNDVALVQSFPRPEEGVGTETGAGRVSYAQLYRWHQELLGVLKSKEKEESQERTVVVGINLTPFSMEETAMMLLVAEQRRWIYVALDVQLPVARQLALLQSSGAQCLVTTVDSPLATYLVENRGEAIHMESVDDERSAFLPVQVVTLLSTYFSTGLEEAACDTDCRQRYDQSIDAPMYILFTSGTTGKAKRVLGSRRGAWTRLVWMWNMYPFATSKDGRSSGRVLRATRLSFVDSVWEILGAFLQRVPLVHVQLPRHRGESMRHCSMTSVVLDDSTRFLKVIQRENVTRFTAVPSVLDVLLQQTTEIERKSCLAGLRYVLSSGESLPFQVLRRLTASLPSVTILNLYGSTELSGDVTCMELKAPLSSAKIAEWQRHDVPIATLTERGVVGGHETFLVLLPEDHENDTMYSRNGSATLIWPRHHTYEMVTTTRTNRQPITGILFVSGPLLVEKYVGDSQKDMFVDSALLFGNRVESEQARDERPRRWFCTGDICSLIQGRLYFDGRKDSGVKIRGQRVYMEAVERGVALALQETTGGKKYGGSGPVIAFTVSKRVSGLLITCIVAFIISDDIGSTGIAQYAETKAVNAWIAEHYGTAHVPHKLFIVPAKVVPRFAHGKVDRKSLKKFYKDVIEDRDLSMPASRIHRTVTSPTQTLVARLMNEILGVFLSGGDVIDDNRTRTFAELGGNSLLATLFMHELRQELGALPLTARKLLDLTMDEIESACFVKSLSEDTGVKHPVQTTRHIFDLTGERAPSTAESVKRLKTTPNDCSGVNPGSECSSDMQQSRLSCISRYNRSSTSANGFHLPMCFTIPVSSAEEITSGAPSSCLPWKLRRVWQVDLNKCIDASPLVVQHRDRKGSICATWAIVGSHSGQLVCVDVLAAGQEVWRVTLDDRIEACAAVSIKHQLVYIGTHAGSFFALCLQSGVTRWRFDCEGTIKASAVVMDERQLVVCGAYNSKLYGLDAVTGQRQWVVDLDSSIFSTPLYCASPEQLFAATTSGNVVALRVSHDRVEMQWKLQLPAPVFAGLNADCVFEMLIVGCADGQLYGVSMSTGDIQWQVMTGNPIFSSPCVYQPGSIVFGSHDGMLRKVHCNNGKLAWTTDLHSAVFASPTVIQLQLASTATSQNDSKDTGRLICCVTTTAGCMYFCDALTGSILYETCESTGNPRIDTPTGQSSAEVLGPLFSSPVVVDNWCLLGTRTNKVYGFELVCRAATGI